MVSGKAEKLIQKVKEDYLLLQGLAQVLPDLSIEYLSKITEMIRHIEKACRDHTTKALTYIIEVCREKQIGVSLTNSEREEFFKLMEKENAKYELNKAKYGREKQGEYHV